MRAGTPLTQTHERAGYRCEVCGDQGDKWPVVCQEEYQYDSESLSRNRQTFRGFVASAQHVTRSNMRGGPLWTGVEAVSSQPCA